MRQTVHFILVLVISVLFFSSCSSFYYGLTNNTNNHQTDVVLSQKNYKIVKYVEGESTAKYIFGIGGAGKSGMIAKARENMLKNSGLIGKSRAVINETVEIKTTIFLIYTEVRYVVSAYIVEFYQSGDPEPEVEANVYIEPEQPIEKTIIKKGTSFGVNIQQPVSNDYGTDFEPKLGYHLGLKAEFSKPNTIKNFFWEAQLNLTHLAFETANPSFQHPSYYSNEKSFNIYIPFLIGYKMPINNQLQWFLKGGPELGFTFFKSEGDDNESGLINTSGIELMTGICLNSKYQLGFGHKWTGGGYSDYDFTNISFSYMF